MQSLLWRSSRWLLALVLFLACTGCSWALAEVLRRSQAADFWLALSGGALCWLIVFFSLPKPMWVYVVGHELTHAIWAWLSGGRVRSLKACAAGGHVVLSKTNTLIALSPYFFPLYAVLWALLYTLGRLMVRGTDLTAWFHFGLGFSYAFHVTLTARILRIRQPDIAGEGRILSVMVIWLGNVLVLLLGLPLLTRDLTVLGTVALALERTGQVIAAAGALGQRLIP